MGDWRVIEAAKVVQQGADYGQALTAGSANVKGVWAQLSASTPFDASGLLITLGRPSAAARYLVDIGLGASSAEREIIANIMFANGQAGGTALSFFIPIPIKAGQRLVGRCQSSTGSATIRLTVHLITGGFPGLGLSGKATTYGADTADSGGMQVDAHATDITAYGAWSELSASIEAISWMVVLCSDQANTANTSQGASFDIGAGAASAERVLAQGLAFRIANTETSGPCAWSFPFRVAAGQRLAG